MDFNNVFTKKKNTPYKVRSITKSVKDIDLDKRIVTGMYNSYFYIDSDLDMLLPNCAAKSIQERGVGSTKGNKIKHLKDHDWKQNIADILVLDERTVEINGKQVQGIYHESFYPQSTDSNDMLIKIQAGLYDARSIGFQYEKIELCEKNSNIEEYSKNWNTYYPMAINPEVADESGYFWVVKEIKLWEGSDVTFGANELTPLLAVKGQNKDFLITELYSKMDNALSLIKNGNISDDGFHVLNMEFNQIKSYIASIDSQPSMKNTILANSRNNNDTGKKKMILKMFN